MSSRRRAPAQEAMLRLITSYWASQLVFVAAKLGIADVLARGPQTPEAIAKRVGAHPANLHRMLRALASLGVFAESAGGRFRLTPTAQMLRSDKPGSLRHLALMLVERHNWDAWGALEHGVRTGELPFEHIHGLPEVSYLQRHPEKEQVAALASAAGNQNDAIARAYPFARCKCLVDVGGAHGHLLATILRKHKTLRGVLFDQPQVVEAAASSGYMTAPGVRERCLALGGDFFRCMPEGADVYLLKHVMHDWDDDQCLKILINCRAAMAPEGRVLVVDHVIPGGNGRNWAKLLDINMLVVPGGRERTKEEFRNLFARAELRLAKVIPTRCPLSILEAVPE